MTEPTPLPVGEPHRLPVYLTPLQVADALAVHERTVRRWAAEDPTCPVTRLGKVIRFERQALLRWLARKQPRLARTTGSAEQGPAQAATPAA